MAAQRLRAFSGIEGCRVTALAARNPATGGPLAREYDVPLHGDWRELVASDEVDAAVVCTSNDSHGTICLAALEAGKAGLHGVPRSPATSRKQKSVVRTAREKKPRRPRRPRRSGIGRAAVAAPAGGFPRPVAAGGVHALDPRPRGPARRCCSTCGCPAPRCCSSSTTCTLSSTSSDRRPGVQAHTEYTGLEPGSGRYQSFVNTLTAGFRSGGTAVWTWAGGVEVAQAEQRRQLLLAGGSLAEAEEGWILSSRSGSKPVHPPAVATCSLESRFAAEVAGEPPAWEADLELAREALRISLMGEVSAREGRRVPLC